MRGGDVRERGRGGDGGGAEIHVVKNSFLKRAMADSGFPAGDGKLTGQTAVVTGKKDVAPVAKAFKTFVTEFKKAMLKLGFIDRAAVSTADLEALADLPPENVLRGQLLGLLLSPATKLVRVLNEPGTSLPRLLNANASKGELAPKADVPSQEEQTVPAPAPAATESKGVTSSAETQKEKTPATEVTG